jgi:hypothetical protein
MYHTGMEPSEWLAPGAYVRNTETLIAHLGLLTPEQAAVQQRYIPGEWSRRYWKLSRVERAEINQEADRRFSKEIGSGSTLDRGNAKDQQQRWQWLRIRDEVTARRLSR